MDRNVLLVMGAAALGLGLLLGFWPLEKTVDGNVLKCGSAFVPKEPPLVKQVGFDGEERWVESNGFAQKYCSDEMSSQRTIGILASLAGVVMLVGGGLMEDKKKKT